MSRAHYYQNQIAAKLLCSKFVYPSVPNPQCVKKLIIKSNVKVKNPEVGSATLNILFGRRPTFAKALHRQEKEYRLVHLILTSNKNRITADLDLFSSALLPFQFENKFRSSKVRNERETS
jgi:hypothetical protein